MEPRRRGESSDAKSLEGQFYVTWVQKRGSAREKGRVAGGGDLNRKANGYSISFLTAELKKECCRVG